jgi:hypothetical protein
LSFISSEYRYNPLHNDLDACALAVNIASLLNNLFGRGKEPFWQQAYSNLVKFIILLHKIAYDYVTFFNVYECAISPALLEQRITLVSYVQVISSLQVILGSLLGSLGSAFWGSVSRAEAGTPGDKFNKQ